MYVLFCAVVVGLLALLVAEHVNKRNLLPKEVARKLPHMTIAILASALPFFVSYEIIVIGSLIVLGITSIAKQLGLFKHLREVGRLSWGEFFIPLGVIGASLFEPNEWVFCASILLMGLADGAAAIVGSKFGKHSFVYLGHKKSLEGSGAFFVVAVIITSLLMFAVPSGLENVPIAVALLFPILITAVEGLSPFGTDNFFIPVITTFVFSVVL